VVTVRGHDHAVRAMTRRWAEVIAPDGGPDPGAFAAGPAATVVARLAAGERADQELFVWAAHHGAEGWDVADLFAWLTVLEAALPRRLRAALDLRAGGQVAEGWADGHDDWVTARSAVEPLTGLCDAGVLAEHLRLTCARADAFGVPPAQLATIAVAGPRVLADRPLARAEAQLLTARAVRRIVPAESVCAALGSGRVACLLPRDEQLPHVLGRLLVELAVTPHDPPLSLAVHPLPGPDWVEQFVTELT
jgi:hypothetical protein